MKRKKVNIKSICRCLIAVVLVSLCFLTFRTMRIQNLSGSYSSVCHMTESSREWVIEHFGEYEDIESLLTAIDRYACENFTYVSKDFYIQNFNLDKFIYEDKMHGLCFDFACFVKNVVATTIPKAKAYAVDVILSDGGRHSYNFIEYNGKGYYIDVTNDVYLSKNNQKALGYWDITEQGLEDFAKKYGDTIYNIH